MDLKRPIIYDENAFCEPVSPDKSRTFRALVLTRCLVIEPICLAFVEYGTNRSAITMSKKPDNAFYIHNFSTY